MNTIFSSYSVSVSDLKKNPTKLLQESDGEAIAVLNHNKPSAYLVPAETYEQLLERLEDLELGKLVEARKSEKDQAVEVSLNEL